MYNYTSIKFLVFLVVFQFALQESLGVQYWNTVDIVKSHKRVNSNIQYTNTLVGIAERWGCACSHQQFNYNNNHNDLTREMYTYCNSQGLYGIGENLLYDKTKQAAEDLILWRSERPPNDGHLKTMRNAKRVGCYMTKFCNCNLRTIANPEEWTVRCLYCE